MRSDKMRLRVEYNGWKSLVVSSASILILVFVYTFPVETMASGYEKIVSANNRFAFKLYSEIIETDSGENVFISPSSIAFALEMTLSGATGETRKAMAEALELQGLALKEINNANRQLLDTLESADPKIKLTIANSLWARKGIQFKPDFIKGNEDCYNAELTTLDFSDPNAPQIINKWVSEKTNKKIQKIINSVDPLDILFLINAVYFKGIWTNQFDKDSTREDDFYLADGKKKKVQMMHQSKEYRYYRGPGFQAVSLPYGNERFSMYIFLPDSGRSLEEFQRKLTAEDWEYWIRRFGLCKGRIALPRFKLEYEISLNDALKSLGMNLAFDKKRADFSGMVSVFPNGNIYIAEVKHKTFVEVNEEGTEAAAVTDVRIRATSLPPPPFVMICDRPFFCAIRDNRTGTILFMGSIFNPGE